MAVFFYDLLRTTRRGRIVLLRIAYALVLLMALYKLHSDRFAYTSAAVIGPVKWTSGATDSAAMAKFAEEFTGLFLFVQMAAVLLLTPAYTAGTIAEERERDTLDSLLVTHLTPFRIVTGKLAARLMQLFGILLTGLPILALLPLWGGVSPMLILWGFALTAQTMLWLGALGVLCSARARTVRGAVTTTYIIAGLLSVCPLCWFVNPLWALPALFGGTIGFVEPFGFAAISFSGLFHVFTALVMIELASRSLVPRAQPESMTASTLGPTDSSLPRAGWPRTEPGSSLPPVGDRPLLWKELHFGANEAFRFLLYLIHVFFFVLAALGVILFLLSGMFFSGPGAREQLNDIVRVVAVGTLLTAIVGTVLQAAASVARERQRRTLDMLMTLPNGRDEVLRMKWLASIMCGRWLLPALVGVLVLGMLGGGVHPLAVPLFVIAAAIHVGFAASLGIFLSVTIRSTDRAGFIAVSVLFLAFVVPLAFCPGGLGFVPPLAWIFLLPRPGDLTGMSGNPGYNSPMLPLAVLLGLVGYACVAAVLWLLAVRHFHRETDRAAIA